jgi:multiple sugar transport system substrate-binding protein
MAYAYKFKLVETAKIMEESDENKGKTIVSVWLKDSPAADTRRYQIEKYNEENKDNIFISLEIEDESYSNLLKTALATSDKPDIFEYGYSELYRYEKIMDMQQFGLDINKIGEENFLYYKKKPMGVKILGNNVKLIWNKEMLKGAGIDPESQPKTFEELLAYAIKIKKAYPNVIPFEFPATTIGELQISIGEMSVNKGSIYTTFWDYKKGNYNFDYAKDILNIYSKMYSLGLICEDFADKNKVMLRSDFASQKTAMIISTFQDKNYFDNIMPLDFSIGISNLPKIDLKDSQNYYYTENYSCLVVNKDVENEDKDKVAIKKVYQLFLEPEINNQLLATKKALPIFMDKKVQEKDIYREYNNDTNFRNELFDPTPFINYKEKVTRQLFYEAIMGKQKVDNVIKKLNSNYASYCKFMKDNYSFDFSEFRE